MTEEKQIHDTKKLENIIVHGMQEKKALDIVVLDLKHISNSVAEYFVICSGNSDIQLDSIAESVEEEVYKSFKLDPWQKEGKENKEWILLDYADVVVHIFRKDRREFYSLEKLWGDAIVRRVVD